MEQKIEVLRKENDRLHADLSHQAKLYGDLDYKLSLWIRKAHEQEKLAQLAAEESIFVRIRQWLFRLRNWFRK